MNPNVVCFYDNTSSTASYVISDRSTRRAAIIDPVLDLDPVSWRVSSGNAQKIADYVTKESLTVDWILETHIHADHVTGASKLKNITKCTTIMGSHTPAESVEIKVKDDEYINLDNLKISSSSYILK